MNGHLLYLLIAGLTVLSTFVVTYFFAFKKLNIQEKEDETITKPKINILESEKGWASIQKKVENSVVQVFSVSSIFNWLQPYKSPIQITVSGSGFFINDQGHFITNSHVVDQAKSIWIQIPILGRKNLDAEIIGVCPDRDLALLKVKKEGLDEIKSVLKSISFLDLGDSDQIYRTDKVLSLGYPLGQHFLKATTGIVSGREHIEDQLFIQIDAAINPGSSGGPVLNENGEVIGITTVMVPTAQSVGYIIPINELKIILNDLYSIKFLRKQILGIGFHASTAEQVEYLKNPKPGGLYVNKVYKNSIAHKAGIHHNDMIYEINGNKVDIYGDVSVPWSSEKIPFIDIVSRLSEKQELDLLIYRHGQRKNIKIKFEGAPLYPIRIMYPDYESIDYEIIGGLILMNLTENHVHALFPIAPDLIKYENIECQVDPAVVISYVYPASEIYRLRIVNAGDIITHINEVKVKNLDEVREAIKQSLVTSYVTIKTENAFIVLNIKRVLTEEIKLSQDYKYSITKMTKELLDVVEPTLNTTQG